MNCDGKDGKRKERRLGKGFHLVMKKWEDWQEIARMGKEEKKEREREREL